MAGGMHRQGGARRSNENGKTALFMPLFDEAVAFLKATPDCLILTMGAGNVDQIARRFLAEQPYRALILAARFASSRSSARRWSWEDR